MKPLISAPARPVIFSSICLSVLLLFNVLISVAQHRSILWGVAERGGPKDAGYLFKYDVSDNTLTKMAWLNKSFTEAVYFSEVFKADSNYLYSIKTQNDSLDKATLVRVNRNTNQLETLYTFDPAYYTMVSGALTAYNGKYYGLAWAGKTSSNAPTAGIIFEWDPATNAISNKYYFTITSKGMYPIGQLFLYGDKLYGATTTGGTDDGGVLFEYDPVANSLEKKADFSLSITGRMPLSFLQLFNGKFYGICQDGGAASQGTIFAYDIATGALTKAFDFPSKPILGRPVLVDNKLYAPLPEQQEIIEFNLTGNSLTTYRPRLNGFYLMGLSSPLSLYNGALYGAVAGTWYGNDSSIVFRWTPGSGIATRVAGIDLTHVGKVIRGPFTPVNDKLYGLTERGSNSGLGSLFEIDPAADTAVVKASFGTGIDGYSDFNYSSNLLYMNNRFYGTTERGGHYNQGLLYCFDPVTQKTTRIHDFKKDEPSLPYGSLTTPGPREILGLTWSGPSGSSDGWQYHYLIPDDEFQFIGKLGDYNPLYYYYGAPNPYAAFSHRLYMAKAAAGGEPGGIFTCYPGIPPSPWTRVFSFPVAIAPDNEKGLREINNKLLGLGHLTVEGVSRKVIYKYDLVTNDFSYKVLPSRIMPTPIGLTGFPVELNNKFYVLTTTGCYNTGSLIEWDNIADTVAEYCFENRFTDGNVFGSLTAADGRLYGFSETSIVCFDPVSKSFKTVFKPTTQICNEYFTEANKQLTLTITNELPQIGIPDSIYICLDGPPSTNIAFTATDAEEDSLTVTAYYTDSSLIRNCTVHTDTIANGSLQYSLQVEAAQTEGRATIAITAADNYGGIDTIPVTLIITNRQAVSLAFTIDTLCKKDTSIAFTGGLPAGGLYRIDGIPADTLNPGSLAVGAHLLEYLYPASAGCPDSASRSFYINECSKPGERMSSSSLMVYPNPSTGTVKLENTEQLLTTVHVFNAQGNKIYSKVSADNIIILDLSHLQTGIYYITTINVKGTANGKVEIVK